ncbi:MAG: hypothetical protein VCC00_06480 [Deltaproteobacteria bacterium]
MNSITLRSLIGVENVRLPVFLECLGQYLDPEIHPQRLRDFAASVERPFEMDFVDALPLVDLVGMQPEASRQNTPHAPPQA